jgi:hypothetical protein
MFTLAETLAACDEAKTADTIAAVQIPSFPEEPLLRPTIWETLTSLKWVVENAQLVQRSSSRFLRSSALNRALGELKTILNNQQSLPNAERDLIVNIAQTWQEALLNVAGEVGEIAITEPVTGAWAKLPSCETWLILSVCKCTDSLCQPFRSRRCTRRSCRGNDGDL